MRANHFSPSKIAVTAVVSLLVWGCSSAPEKAVDEEPAQRPALEMEAPDSATLAESPCGGADWSKPPPEVVSTDNSDE